MGHTQWEQRLTDTTSAVVERSESSQDDALYEIFIPTDEDADINAVVPGDATHIETTQLNGTAELRLSVTAPDHSTIERVIIDHGSERGVVFLPSPPFMRACNQVRNGDTDAISDIISAFESPIQLPIICGAVLPLDDLFELLEAVTSVPKYGSSQLHSYRYDIVRTAMTAPPGLTVESTSELEQLVDGLDALEQIGDVALLPAVGDAMWTLHDTAAETTAMLDKLGFDQPALERRDDGFFLTCYLAHLLDTDGFAAAEGHAMKRRWRVPGNYERRVTEAQTAAFAERGSAWRSLVCAAARQGRQEFAYVLANACYWSAETRHTDARVSELLYQSAITAARVIELEALKAQARFSHQLGIAHRLRSRRQFALAVNRFETAETLGSEHDSLPTWRARYGRGICTAHALSNTGQTERSVAELETTIEALLQHDIDDAILTESIHHLNAQKHEQLAESASNPDEAKDHYETASTHYRHAGLDRSRRRCVRKQEQLADAHQDPVEDASQGFGPDSDSDRVSTQAPALNDATVNLVADPLPPEIHAAETGQFPIVANDNGPSAIGTEDVGTQDPGSIPDADETADDMDDPYIF